MPIAITCESCGSHAQAPEAAAGRKLPCPKCRSPITVPAQSKLALCRPPIQSHLGLACSGLAACQYLSSPPLPGHRGEPPGHRAAAGCPAG